MVNLPWISQKGFNPINVLLLKSIKASNHQSLSSKGASPHASNYVANGMYFPNLEISLFQIWFFPKITLAYSRLSTIGSRLWKKDLWSLQTPFHCSFYTLLTLGLIGGLSLYQVFCKDWYIFLYLRKWKAKRKRLPKNFFQKSRRQILLRW
jgi:hypothetical protein